MLVSPNYQAVVLVYGDIKVKKRWKNKNALNGSTWLAQSVEHVMLDLRVVSLNPTLGVELTYKKIK